MKDSLDKQSEMIGYQHTCATRNIGVPQAKGKSEQMETWIYTNTGEAPEMVNM